MAKLLMILAGVVIAATMMISSGRLAIAAGQGTAPAPAAVVQPVSVPVGGSPIGDALTSDQNIAEILAVGGLLVFVGGSASRAMSR
jgi:hypothetical protein